MKAECGKRKVLMLLFAGIAFLSLFHSAQAQIRTTPTDGGDDTGGGDNGDNE